MRTINHESLLEGLTYLITRLDVPDVYDYTKGYKKEGKRKQRTSKEAKKNKTKRNKAKQSRKQNRI